MAPTLFAIKSTFRRALLSRDGSPGSSTPSSTGFPFATTLNGSATGTPIPTNNMSTNGTSVAGVVAGAVVAGLALMLGVAYCLYRRERSMRSKRQTIDLTGEIAAGKLADYGEKKVADLNIGPVPLSESSTSTPDGASRPPLNSESTTGRNLDQRSLDPVSSRPSTRAAASGLPAHPGALGRMVSQRVLPDTRPWPPSILRRPPNGSEVRPSATNVVRSTRFQDLSPPPRHLHLVGEPALSSPPSTPGRLTPQIPSGRDTPEEGPTASAEISIITDNLPPGIDVHSSVPATPAPAYSPSPPYLLTDLPPLPITPLSTAVLPQASPMNPVAAPSTGDGQPPAPDQETINIPIRESLLPSLVSPHSPIHEKPETSANMGIPSRSSSIRELSSSGRPSQAPSPSIHTPVPLPPPSALSAISRSFSVHRSTSIASPPTVRAGLPTSPRPVRMPSSTPRSSRSGSGHEATLTRSASAHEVRKHRESGSGDSNAAIHGAMLWRHPTAHTPRS